MNLIAYWNLNGILAETSIHRMSSLSYAIVWIAYYSYSHLVYKYIHAYSTAQIQVYT